MNSLIVRNDSALSVSFSEDAMVLRESALVAGALVGRVTCPDEQSAAVGALRDIAGVLRSVEKARKDIKQPILDYGRAIDEAAKKFVLELDKEEGRISNLISEFQLCERRRIAAEEAKQKAELDRIERERAVELAKAQTLEEQDRIMEDFSRRAAAESQPILAPKAQGQVSKSDWEIQITNPYDLAKFHPNAVTITPKLGEIKAMLTQGIQVRGITARPIVNTIIRTGRTSAAIEI